MEAVSDSLILWDTGNVEENSAACSDGLVEGTGVDCVRNVMAHGDAREGK